MSEEEGSGDDEDAIHGEKEDINKSATSPKHKGKRKRTVQNSDVNPRYILRTYILCVCMHVYIYLCIYTQL